MQTSFSLEKERRDYISYRFRARSQLKVDLAFYFFTGNLERRTVALGKDMARGIEEVIL